MEILEIQESDFESTIASTELILMDCYADWCGPCKSQSEILENEGEKLAKTYPNIKLIKINTDEAHGIADVFGINSIPQLIVIYKGYAGIMKAGVKTIPEVLEFINELITAFNELPDNMSSNNVEILLDMNHATIQRLDSTTIDSFLTQTSLGMILFYNDEWPPAWIMMQVIKGGGNEFLEEFPELKFASYFISNDNLLNNSMGIQMVPQVVITYNKKINFMAPGYRQLDEIAQFIHEVQNSSESIDLRLKDYMKIVRVDGENWSQIQNQNELVLLLFWDGTTRNAIRQLLIIQREQTFFTEKYPNLVLAYASSDDSPDLMKKYDISTIPTNLIFYKGFFGRMLPGEKSPTTTCAFIQDVINFIDNHASIDSLSKDKVVIIQQELVHTVASGDFDSYIASHDLVLVDFWAEWCGPCKSQGMILEEYAKELSEIVPSLTFIKVNTDEDEGLSSDRYKIDAIPQLMIFYKDAYGFAHPGVMEPEELLTFINEFQEIYKTAEIKSGCLIPLQMDPDADLDDDDSDDDDSDDDDSDDDDNSEDDDESNGGDESDDEVDEVELE